MTEEFNKEKILARLKKMLALGRNAGATEAERETAMRMAQSLLAKYNLSIAEAEAHGEKVDEERVRYDSVFYGRPWARNVANAVAKLLFCRYIYTPATVAKNTRHSFVGRHSNAVSAAELAMFLVDSITREGRAHQRKIMGANEAFRAFGWGAAASILERVEKILEETKAEKQPGTSLVLASVYQQELVANTKVFDVMFPKTRKGHRGQGFNSRSAFAAGQEYGNKVGLNNQLRSQAAKPVLLK